MKLLMILRIVSFVFIVGLGVYGVYLVLHSGITPTTKLGDITMQQTAGFWLLGFIVSMGSRTGK